MAGQSFQNGQTLGQFFEPLYLATVTGQRVGARENYSYHSQGQLASLRGCEVLLVIVQASTGYCVLYGCPSRCTTCGCHSTKAMYKNDHHPHCCTHFLSPSAYLAALCLSHWHLNFECFNDTWDPSIPLV